MSCKKRSPKTLRGCGKSRSDSKLENWESVVADYRKNHYGALECELEKFAEVYREKGLEELVRSAASGKDPETGERMPHQNSRFSEKTLQCWMEELSGITGEIGQCRTFEQLHELLEQKMGNIDHIGPLTCYDTAQRIGYALGFPPRDYVYLHVGAQLPCEKEQNSGRVAVSELEKSVTEELSAYHIENMLCFYNGRISKSLRKSGTR